MLFRTKLVWVSVYMYTRPGVTLSVPDGIYNAPHPCVGLGGLLPPEPRYPCGSGEEVPPLVYRLNPGFRPSLDGEVRLAADVRTELALRGLPWAAILQPHALFACLAIG